MTDEERFEALLRELGALLLELGTIGLADDVVLIGAQVVALEQRARSARQFEVETSTGVRLQRSYSLEPDLVFDIEDAHRLEELPEALRRCGFERATRLGRPSTWAKQVGDLLVELDLFTTADCSEFELPTPMTRLRGAPRFPLRQIPLSGHATIRVPNAYAFLSLKLEAKLRIRPRETKDSLDMYAYVQVVGADAVNSALANAGADAGRVRRELAGLFGDTGSVGVSDVLSSAQSMGQEERALVARAVVDAFEAIVIPASED